MIRLASLTRPLAVASTLVVLGGLAACGGGDDSTAGDDASPSAAGSSGSGATCDYPSAGAAAKDVKAPPATPDVSGTVKATMTTSIGDFDLSLDAGRAPCTVNSFVSLAKQGYFDKTPCHRLTTRDILVLQCGDPTGTGTGGPGYTIPDELKGDESYTTGVLAMAKTQFPDSGGSQFFIVYGDSTALDSSPNYTVFGSVDDATVKEITQLAKGGTKGGSSPYDGSPATPVDISKVTIG